jgi:hypothetical protein
MLAVFREIRAVEMDAEPVERLRPERELWIERSSNGT